MFGKGMKREKRKEKKGDLFCLICKAKINGKKYISILLLYPQKEKR